MDKAAANIERGSRWLLARRFEERLTYARTPGGLVASAWWLARAVTGLEMYRLYGRRCQSTGNECSGDLCFRAMRDLEDVSTVPVETVELLGRHSGKSVPDLLRRGTTVYFLTDGERVICQMLSSPGDRVSVDTPRGLVLDVGDTGVFISYVYTHPPYRRAGAGGKLLAAVEADLCRLGKTHAFAHVSATNVPSLRTFDKAGWRRIGAVLFDKSGKMLLSRQQGEPHVAVGSKD